MGRERERVRLMWVFATICGYLLRRLVFATVANTEGGYLSRKVRYLPPQHTRILSICYSCNYVTTRICILSRFSLGGYLLQQQIRRVGICYVKVGISHRIIYAS